MQEQLRIGRTVSGSRVRGLDGLRGVAIVMVVLAHSRPWNLPYAGEIGVSLFFTLSGFLITSILLAEHARTTRIDLRAFYARRSLRLVPGLVVLVAGATLLIRVAADPRFDRDFGLQALAALTYTANFPQAAGAQWPILGHTWSLAIEEQFYLVWPAILLIVLRLSAGSRARLGKMLLALALVAAAWRMAAPLLLDGGVSRVYYAPDTNAFGLLAGAALAALPPERRRLPASAGYGALALIGVMALVQSFGEGSLLPLYLVSVAAMLSLPVIAAADRMRLLAAPPLVLCGTLSYSWYLWNSPIINLRPHGHTGGSPVHQVGALLLSLLAALLSYRCVERPALRLKARFEGAELETGLQPEVPAQDRHRVDTAATPDA